MKNTENKANNTKKTNNKEDKVMKNNKTNTKSKKAKEVVEEVKTEVVETKVEEVKTEEVKNEVKENQVLTIQEVTALYEELGIKCYNPNAKGNYRIMGSSKGSSLNIVPRKGEYRIYSTGDDFALVSAIEQKPEDLIVEEGTNSQDRCRPNTIVCKALETLKAVLAVYATNPINRVAETK